MGNRLSKRRKHSKRRTGETPPRSSQVSFTTTTSSLHTRTSQRNVDFTLAKYTAFQVQKLHYLFKHVFQRNLVAPVDELLELPGSQCVDIGCGPTATWLIDMAAEYPNAMFTGIDIIVMGPALNTTEEGLLPRHIPNNCHFKRINVLQDLTLPPNSFDLVYQRFMFNVYEVDKTIQPKFSEITDLLKPGGYIELIEPDIVPKQAGPKYTVLITALNDLITERKRPIYHGPLIKQYLVDAGLEDVHSDYISIPICWGGYVGKMLYESIVCVISQLGPELWDRLELDGEYDGDVYNEYVDTAFNECVEHKTYANFHWAYGRRPVNNKDSG